MILVAAAFAADVPERPVAPAPVIGECSRAIPIEIGKPVPTFDLKGLPTCGGVLLPSSNLADLLSTEVWAKEVYGRYRVDTAALEAQLAIERGQVTWWREQAEKNSKPSPKPVTWLGIGLISGIGLALGTEYLVLQVYGTGTE